MSSTPTPRNHRKHIRVYFLSMERYWFVINVSTVEMMAETLRIQTTTLDLTPVAVNVMPTFRPSTPIQIYENEMYTFFLLSDFFLVVITSSLTFWKIHKSWLSLLDFNSFNSVSFVLCCEGKIFKATFSLSLGRSNFQNWKASFQKNSTRKNSP